MTQFFRDPDTFVVLRERVLAKLVASGPKNETVRVWVPACAIGEEVYTLAILLREQQRESGLPSPIQIFATDIDRPALEYARLGLYPDSISEHVPAAFLERYFDRTRAAYSAKTALRGKGSCFTFELPLKR